MKYRSLGSTGKMVSEIGFGAWQLGNAIDWSSMSEAQGIALVQAAYSQGINFFDTAPGYGLGQSESILGMALKDVRKQVVINTKFGHRASGEVNFSVDSIRSAVEESLMRLKTDYVDSLLLHNPDFKTLSNEFGHFTECERLKQEGLIHAYGASVDSSQEMMAILEHTDSQVIEVMFNIFHQEPQEAFKLAQSKNVGLIIKVPLDSGFLSGKYNEKSQFHDIRSRWSTEDLEKRTHLLTKLYEFIPQDQLARTSLQFILAHKVVSTVIPGAKNQSQLQANIAASETMLSSETLNKLYQFYENEIKHHPLPW